jgi:AmmeMemoRadiSam system protein B
MAPVRPAAVAGAFYEADPVALERSLAGMMAAASAPDIDLAPRAVIVPHAGHIYSGPTAAVAYLAVPPVTRVVLLGPSHFVRFSGIAAPTVEAFETPLGAVPIDAALLESATGSAVVVTNDVAHAREHSLEVQLPFLQHTLGAFTMLPLLTGEVSPEAAAGVLDSLLVDDVVAVVSSDLSHYLDYDAARQRDERTAKAIVELRPDDLAWEDACGRIAVQAALLVARRRGWACRLLDLRSSGDTAGSRSRVVGYGAFALGPPA